MRIMIFKNSEIALLIPAHATTKYYPPLTTSIPPRKINNYSYQ